MRMFRFAQPSRGGAEKTQFRSMGRLNLANLPADQAQEIRALKARLDERIAEQEEAEKIAAAGPSTVSSSATWARAQTAPKYLLEEDQMIQLLRSRGFCYKQIHDEFVPRRSVSALTVRRRHQKRTHAAGFVYIPDVQVMGGPSTTEAE